LCMYWRDHFSKVANCRGLEVCAVCMGNHLMLLQLEPTIVEVHNKYRNTTCSNYQKCFLEFHAGGDIFKDRGFCFATGTGSLAQRIRADGRGL
jgi:hypothetical protein